MNGRPHIRAKDLESRLTFITQWPLGVACLSYINWTGGTLRLFPTGPSDLIL